MQCPICVPYLLDDAICALTNPFFSSGIPVGSPRRRREDRRHHESDRSHRHRSRAEESAKAVDRDQKRDRPLQDAAQPDDPLRAETKPLDDARNGSPARHERSPRGTKRFPESRDARRPRSFFQVLVFFSNVHQGTTLFASNCLVAVNRVLGSYFQCKQDGSWFCNPTSFAECSICS